MSDPKDPSDPEEARFERHLDRVARLRKDPSTWAGGLIDELREAEHGQPAVFMEEAGLLPQPPEDLVPNIQAAARAAWTEDGLSEPRSGWIKRLQGTDLRWRWAFGVGLAAAVAALLFIVLPPPKRPDYRLAETATAPVEAVVARLTLAVASKRPAADHRTVFELALRSWQISRGRGPAENEDAFSEALRGCIEGAKRGALDPEGALSIGSTQSTPLSPKESQLVVGVLRAFFRARPEDRAVLGAEAAKLYPRLTGLAQGRFALDVAQYLARNGDPAGAQTWARRVLEQNEERGPGVEEAARDLIESLKD